MWALAAAIAAAGPRPDGARSPETVAWATAVTLPQAQS